MSRCTGGALNLAGPTNTAGSLLMTGGALTATGPLGLGSTVLDGGTIAGPGAIDFNASLVWSGGTIAGPGTRTVMGTLTTSGNDAKTLNNTTLRASGGGTLAGTLGLSGGSTLGLTGGTHNLFGNVSGGRLIIASGATLERRGIGTSTVSVASFGNAGTLRVVEGALQLTDFSYNVFDATFGGALNNGCYEVVSATGAAA